jgi:hypothetical protein
VQLVEPAVEQVVEQGRLVDHPAGQGRVDDVGFEVEHPLPEAVRGGGAAGVGDVGRQQQDGARRGAVLVPVQVVADHTVVDDHQRPRVVRVGRVDVVGEARVEGLGDPGYTGHPRTDLAHVTNVQERAATPPARSTSCVSRPRSS